MVQLTKVSEHPIIDFIAGHTCQSSHGTFDAPHAVSVKELLKLCVNKSAGVRRHAELVLMALLEGGQGFQKSDMLIHCFGVGVVTEESRQSRYLSVRERLMKLNIINIQDPRY